MNLLLIYIPLCKLIIQIVHTELQHLTLLTMIWVEQIVNKKREYPISEPSLLSGGEEYPQLHLSS